MLGRRILRIKAFKALYSYAENPSMSLKEAEGLLELSCEATRDLYLFMLAVAGPLTAEARSRIEAARSKFNPTEEERNPNLKFVNNAIAPLLENDPDFTKIIKRKKLSWDQYDVLLRHLYEHIREQDYFKAYLASPKTGIAADAALFVRIYEEEFVDNSELESILEDLSIYWNDDLAYALTFCCRTMEELGRGKGWAMPELYQSQMNPREGMQSDKAFVFGVLRTGYRHFEDYCSRLAELTPKWDRNRICTTDLSLIVAGMAEADCFKDTPKKIIINEYVEISKFYSTPESSGFVNGLLDKLIERKL